ncbi:hypothetical protein HW555_006717 [Spodoptera exigua]|uniref:Phenoloxidase-activating factor 2 n=1 Tax=Spodoptera exigua TaxID=7107 RepID=A0A835GE44_SPOEX|nr:hypothetical protein HW555_006717 [Spodoptera exigua]
MLKILPFFILLVTVSCENSNVDALIDQIFGPTTAKVTQEPNRSTVTVDQGNKTCTTPDGLEGECVVYYLCNATNSTPEPIIDLHFNENECVSYVDVCCHKSHRLSDDHYKTLTKRSPFNEMKEKMAENPTVPDPTPTAPGDTSKGEILCQTRDGKQEQIDVAAVKENVCSSYMDVCCEDVDKLPYAPLEREGCGWANPAGLSSIKVPPEETRFGEFPWMVAILEKVPLKENDPDSEKLNVYIGGGSLIHPSVVLTVAHYVHNKTDIKIRAGEWDTTSTKEPYPYQDRQVASIEIHKDFIKRTLFYDVALLFLAKPVELAPNVGVVCLPAPNVPQEEGTRCLATGWGKDKFGKGGHYSTVLKKVVLPVVNHNSCEKILRSKTRLGQVFSLHSTFMCAGGERDKDTCTGDGGSPLSCPIDTDRFVQSGIVAWGVGCGEDGVPGVYVDVSTQRNWIDDKIIGKGYDPKVYTYVHKGTY